MPVPVGISILALSILVWAGCTRTGHSVDALESAEASRAQRMAWWQEARFGMFIHWGLYAVHGGAWEGKQYGGYSEWLMSAGIPPDEYRPLAKRFHPIEFDADQWVSLARDAGMKYIVITSKHHEGFAMWDSGVTDYDIVDATPYGRDVLGELAEACGRQGIRLGFYYSVLDWDHPDYLPRHRNDARPVGDADFNRYLDFMKAQLTELLTHYGPVAVLWFDGGWEHDPDEYRSEEMVRHVYTLQPATMINDRIALPMDFATPEQRVPEEDLPLCPWETCMTMNGSWGFNRGDTNWKSAEQLVRTLIDIASKGGNFLLNVGPTAEGTIPEASAERLREIGEWMEVNGEAIYGTERTPLDSLGWGRSTLKRLPGGDHILYLHVFERGGGEDLRIAGVGNLPARAYFLADSLVTVGARLGDEGLILTPERWIDTPHATVLALEFEGPAVVYQPPVIEAAARQLVDFMNVAITTPGTGLDIIYTLDGSTPSTGSSRYTGPIRITGDATLKCRTVYRERFLSDVVEATFQKVEPITAVSERDLRAGLRYAYYEGEWDSIPEFTAMVPAATGLTTSIDLDVRQRNENFGLRLSGFVRIPSAALIRFVLNCDDGGTLHVAGREVVNNDGLHGTQARDGYIALGAGSHPLEIEYFNRLGGKTLKVEWGARGEPPRPITPEQLFHGP